MSPSKSWRSAATLALLALSGSAVAQSSAAASSTTSSAAAAATTVAADSSDADINYFTAETVQVTDAVIADISDTYNDTIASLFDFGSNDTSDVSERSSASCKITPSDAAWPSKIVWSLFNVLLGGRLISTVPSASPCYHNWGDYNAAECEYITGNWTDSFFHAADPTSIMSPYWQGLSCTPTGESCTLGGYPTYSVNVTTAAQIQLAVNFARNLNMRLNVKNTGHDFNGKSAGAYALNVWTHNLKDITYVKSYTSGNYTGPAVKFGSGVQAYELYAKAEALGITVVGGEGETVGVGGGFLAGGGHSPLSPIYGMASDQVLAIEVVLPDGRFVTASPKVNPDLFWALRGGGGSTFGVVTSWVVKTHPKLSVAAIPSLYFTNTGTVSSDAFWNGVRAYFKHFKTWAEAGVYQYYFAIPLGSDTYEFLVAPVFAPGKTTAQLTTLMQPWYDELTALGISVSPAPVQYSSFYQAWSAVFPLETVGYNDTRLASRLWPKNNFVDETLRNQTADAIIESVKDYGNILIGFVIKADATELVYESAVNPAWRNTYSHVLSSLSWPYGSTAAEILSIRNATTNGIMAKWRSLSPGAGSYMSEGDPDEPNFQQSFFGADNYKRLYALKKQYDPTGTFYAHTAVGSEDWYVYGDDGQHQQNNKLCKV